MQFFSRVENHKLYDYFGCHKQDNGWVFRVYAPNAKAVFIYGDFNEYCVKQFPLHKDDEGVWSIVLDCINEYNKYQYAIIGADNILRKKGDPFAFYADLRPSDYTKVFDISKLNIDAKNYHQHKSDPLNVYEFYLGGFKRHLHDNSYYDYIELKTVIDHAKGLKFNAIEMMPLNEHPSDCSWGYQPSFLFAPSSRYGDPHMLSEFINYAKANDIKLINDVVVGHFAIDNHGLENFDGTMLYEKYYNNQWGVYNYNFDSEYVRAFLISMVNFYLDVYNFDGVRVDAVNFLIYYDGNCHNGKNKAAIHFLKTLNATIHEIYQDKKITIAEDSSTYPHVTNISGLGFDYKWNLGFMHDTLKYFEKDPLFRHGIFNKLTFSFLYKNNEHYILPYSHDEVVHLKKSMLNKMPGSLNDKFENYKCLLTHMMMHPGKKLSFMGSEFGVINEFDEKNELQWILSSDNLNDKLLYFVKTINQLYLEKEALYKGDYRLDGFEFVHEHADDGILVYKRKYNGQEIFVILNTSGEYYEDYHFYFTNAKHLEIILNSADPLFGGNLILEKNYTLDNGSVYLKIAPNSAIVLQKVN